MLIARHEPVLTDTTNVKAIAKFANRKRKATIDGIEYDGWFASDFTLAEIKDCAPSNPVHRAAPGSMALSKFRPSRK